MDIQLRSVLDVAQVLGAKEQTVSIADGATVGGLVALLLEKHGEPLRALVMQGGGVPELAPHVKLYVNGRGVDFLEGMDTLLKDGDDVVIMPQISGG